MFNQKIKLEVENILKRLEFNSDDLLVLNGIPLSLIVDTERPSIESIIYSKLYKYFVDVIEKRNIVTMAEYYYIKEYANDEFERIIILNNNLYMNLYPLDLDISEDLEYLLERHFLPQGPDIDEDKETKKLLAASRFLQGFIKTDKSNYGIFLEKDNLNEKEINVDLFSENQGELELINTKINTKVILEEIDYLKFLEEINNFNYSQRKTVVFRTDEFLGDKELLLNHLKLINSLIPNLEIKINNFVASTDLVGSRPEFKEILKKYWNHDSFRNLKVYDIDKLNENKKVIKEISQEKIISEMVNQVENYLSDVPKEKRDIFITAPTGAGKSVIFQVPAIYLAEKYNLLTIVISPLIGLMKDQVKGLHNNNYKKAVTINSEVSPMEKMEIREKINDGTYNILYISPETLLGRADIQDLIGERKIGMFIIDEAHIVTTWGKQFRPDYWYLGDHLENLKKNSPLNSGFLIATFTATAIYKGEEDMFEETKSSLHLFNPIVYLGYIKRDNILIEIDRSKKADNVRSELEFDKFGELEVLVDKANENKEKLLIYFPTVRLLNRFVEYIQSRKKHGLLLKYHGQLTKEEKNENYLQFMNSEKYAMAATKAFGMGIDISDIYKIAHFAPTGNVCDYVQEIGRAARKKSIEGEAYYHYNPRDFTHINRLHGMSVITKAQLIQVLHKIYELFISNRKMGSNNGSKSNSLLIDTNTFSGVFDNKGGDEETIINKIKTALLMIQKDFIAKIGFSPITVKPIPLFSHGYFRIEERDQNKLIRKFGQVIEKCDEPMKIVKVNLESIWKQSYTDLSFPKFKFHIYSSREDLDFFKDFHYTPTVYVQIDFKSDANSQFSNVITVLNSILRRFITERKYYSKDEIVEAFYNDYSKTGFTRLNKTRIRSIVQSFISTCIYHKGRRSTNQNIIYEKPLISGDIKYQFRFGADSVIQFISKGKATIFESTKEGDFYIVDYSGNEMKDYTAVLGFLESIGILNFKMLGGENSQLYIYINQIQSITNILKDQKKYQNKLLKTIDYRHRLSAKMLTYIYEREFSSGEIWNIIEDYFLGKIPEWVLEEVKLDEERRIAEWRKRNLNK